MKNVIKYASILLVAAMSFTACDDWMNEDCRPKVCCCRS